MRRNFRTVTLLILSLLGTAAGIFLLVRVPGNWRNALSAIMFCGACAGVFSMNLREDHRLKKQIQQGGVVSLAGGVQISNQSTRMFIVFLTLALLGSYSAVFTTISPAYNMLMAVVGLVGCLGLVMLQFKLNYRYLCFKPEGIELGGRRSKYLLAWDNLQALELVKVNDNIALGLSVISDERLWATVNPSDRLEKFKVKMSRIMAWNEKIYGFHFLLLPGIYNLEGGNLYRAMERYFRNPETRGELNRQAGLPTATEP